MRTKILFRKSLADEGELLAAKSNFDIIELRSEIKPGDFIIPRYSSLPYYSELEKDIKNLGGNIINSYEQHRWIADFQYYDRLAEYTFQTWTWDTIRYAPKYQSYVVKGKTNSKKFLWNKMMFAKDRDTAVNIAADLSTDELIGRQEIIFRKYEDLETFETGICDMPITNEWRFFFYETNLIDYGYYWSIIDDESKIPFFEIEMQKYAQNIANICSNYTNFFVLDIAKKKNGDYVLVEINDGTMSGLSCINPENFYSNLRKLTHDYVSYI